MLKMKNSDTQTNLLMLFGISAVGFVMKCIESYEFDGFIVQSSCNIFENIIYICRDLPKIYLAVFVRCIEGKCHLFVF